MELVIVPLHKRPAFALACLTRLYLAAAKDPSLRFYLAIDAGWNHEVAQIAEQFAARVGGGRVDIVKRSRTYRGNSYNVLTSYAETVNCGADMIHLVEEDVLIASDYFDYHRKVRELAPDAFSICACRNQFYNIGDGPPHEEDAFYTQTCYQSIGVSFLPSYLKFVVDHATNAFFSNPLLHLRRHFPHSALKDMYREQDGLIYRIIERGENYTAFPCVPRAYHAGFTGYNRAGQPLPGTTEQQAQRILTMSAQELNDQARSYRDYETIALDGIRAPITRRINWPA